MVLYLTPFIHEGIRHRMTFESSCSKLVSSDTLISSLTHILDVMSLLNKMKETFGSSILSNTIESFLEVNAHLDKEEKKGLESLIKAAKDFEVAINSSNKAVTTLSGLVKSLLESVQIRSGDANSDHVRFIKTLDLYLKRLEENILPDFKATSERISTATDSLLDVSIPLGQLKSWCERKSANVKAERNFSCAKVTLIGIAGIVGAVNFWNPIGWQIAAITAIGSTATISVTTINLKKYQSMLDKLKGTIERFDALVKKADKDRNQLNVKLQILETIREGTEVSKDLGVLIMDETYELIPKFETSLKSLQKSCQEYQEMN